MDYPYSLTEKLARPATRGYYTSREVIRRTLRGQGESVKQESGIVESRRRETAIRAKKLALNTERQSRHCLRKAILEFPPRFAAHHPVYRDILDVSE